jgi:hypothetical protein
VSFWDQPSTIDFVLGIMVGVGLMSFSAIALVRAVARERERARVVMDRLMEKLAMAAAVNHRVAAAIEKQADDLIAREHEVMDRSTSAFEPHHIALDQRMKELDRFEDALQIMENANPLKSGGGITQEDSDRMLESELRATVTKALSTRAANGSDPLNSGTAAPAGTGIDNGADVH